MPRSALGLVMIALFARCASSAQTQAPPSPPPAASAAKAPAATAPLPLNAALALDVPPLRFRYTPLEIKQICDAAEQAAEARLAAIVAIPAAEQTFASAFAALEQATTDYGDAIARVTFMKDVHTSAEVRAAAAACEQQAGAYVVKISARRDLYLAMKGYLDHRGKQDKRDPQDDKLIEITLRDFRRNGLDLGDAERQKLVTLRARLAELQTKFAMNLDEDKTTVLASEKELAGMPASFVRRLAKAKGGKLVLTTQYPDYYPIMENAKNADLRRRLQVAFMNRGGAENLALLNEATALRDQAARLLGYPTHADFVTEVRMAKKAQTVAAFEAKLRESVKLRLAQDLAKMKAIKSAETGQKNPVIYSWDWRYDMNQVKKKEYAVDDEAVRAYFPAPKVMDGMFKVYARLFGVEFREVNGAEVWAPGVKLYEIREARGGPKNASSMPVPKSDAAAAAGGRLLAKFYVDLFPRPGKYGHAASFPLGAARETPAGYQIPLSVLVVNFNPPEGGEPARLSVNEVDTLFHEFGHIMHGSLTNARYNSLAGTNVATDFVEAPSQMLENWVFEPEVLKLISADPKDPQRSMPDDLARRIIAARKFDAGIKYSRQVYLGSFDLFIHTHGDKIDADAVSKRLWREIMGIDEDPREHSAAGFGHVMGGYDAGYYGYLWSEVFAADMFTRFKKEGVLNPETGRAYRDIILAKGRTEEPEALLRRFLGREPSEAAFLRLNGIE